MYYMKPSRYNSLAQTRLPEMSESTISVQVVVLGDIGRSPRMQYHAISISKLPGTVDFIGYTGKAKYDRA